MPSRRPSRRDPFREEFEPEPPARRPAGTRGPGRDDRDPGSADAAATQDTWEPADDHFEGIDGESDAAELIGLTGAGVPAVVAVMVVSDPGPWFDEAVAGLAAQEYPELSVLVLDVASAEDPTPRVAAALPGAFVKRFEQPVGWAVAVNSVLEMVEGAPFLLICHEDAELGPGSVQAMIEQAFRSNAGIVGAKLTDWSAPEHLRSVGFSIDKFAFVAPMAEPGELDQSQHDAVRDAFAVSSAAMLIRSDLFADLGGFATDLDDIAVDLDLCWRARIAGARTVVMPAAEVRHRERAALGDIAPSRRREILRTQGRLVLSNYTPIHLLRVVPQAVALSLFDLLAALVGGRWTLAGDVAAALGWNVVHLPGTIARRSHIKRIRRVDDAEIRRMHARGSVRVARLFRAARTVSGTSGRQALSNARELPDSVGSAGLVALGIFTTVVVLVLLGSRGLITGKVAVLGDLGLTDGIRPLFRAWWHGWRPLGLGHESASPTLLPAFAMLSTLLVGSTGLARLLLVVGPVLIGIWGAWRLGRSAGGVRARVGLAVAYAVNPVVYDSIAAGRLGALACYAGLPWFAGQVLTAVGGRPFSDAPAGAPIAPRAAVISGLTLAAAATVAPVVLPLAAVVGIALGVVATIGRGVTPLLRAVQLTGGALLVAGVVHLPWTLELLGGGWHSAFGTLVGPSSEPSWKAMVGFQTPTIGGVVSIGLTAGASFVLLVGRGWRLRWGVAGWAAILTSWVLVALGSRMQDTWALPGSDVLMVPAALGVALAVAMGVEAYDRDVRAEAFGWRQLAAALTGVAFVVGSLPFLTATFDGRWSQPSTDIANALEPLSSGGDSFRTLWIGAPDSLTGGTFALSDHLAMSLTEGIVPRLDTTLAPDPGRGETEVRRAVVAARSGSTARLGRLLAPYSVRYVIVSEAATPVVTRGDLPGAVVDTVTALDSQIDLERRDGLPGLHVYENPQYLPIRAALAPGGTADAALAEIGDSDLHAVAANESLTGTPVLGVDNRPVSFVGPVAPSTISVSLAREGDWTLTVDGDAVPGDTVLGWAQRYRVTANGTGELSHSPSAGHLLALMASLVATVLLVAIAVAVPSRTRWMRPRRRAAAEPGTDEPTTPGTDAPATPGTGTPEPLADAIESDAAR